ncbi:beta-N-acetylhexosaminidase, partial [Micromonospora chalcea]
MPTTPTAPETGPEPTETRPTSTPGEVLPGVATPAAELARVAAGRATEVLAGPAPVRLDDVVPAPEQVFPD